MLRTVYSPQIRRPASWAWLLLLVLLVHLAFMASPLHVAGMEPDREIASAVGLSTYQGMSVAAGPSVLDAHQYDHCAVEWMAPQAPTIHLLAGSFPGGLRVPADPSLSSDPVSPAIEPPRLADPQALLQVFRI